MKIFVIRGPKIPNCFYKGNSAEEVLQKFFDPKPWKDKQLLEEIKIMHTIRELTVELLIELAPEEFQLSEGIDF